MDHTVRNLTITADPDKEDKAVGFFGVVNGDNYDGIKASGTSGIIRNLKFLNVNIQMARNELTGAAVGLMVNDATVENVSVMDGNITGAKGVGGVVGRMTVCGTIANCYNGASVSTPFVDGLENAGGIVGAAYYTDNCNEMRIVNCENTGKISGGASIGGIVGLSAADVTNCKNSGTITGSYTGTGGIVGEQDPCGTISGCFNSGSIHNSHTESGTGGGIVGWVRYANNAPASYARTSVINVTGNTNTASINGGVYGGGIIGLLYNAGHVAGNTNHAASIAGTKFAAGIVGAYQDHEKPGNLSFAYPDLAVTNDNTSTTLWENIDAPNRNLLIYMNPDVMKAYADTSNTHKHQMSVHPVYDPQCTTTGFRLFYTCDWCHAVFDDSEGEHELAPGYMIMTPKKFRKPPLRPTKRLWRPKKPPAWATCGMNIRL